MTSQADKDHQRWKAMTDECERRRKALGLTVRGFSVKAGLDASYYGHWLRKQFMFPSVTKWKQITDALERLETLKKIEEQMMKEAEQ